MADEAKVCADSADEAKSMRVVRCVAASASRDAVADETAAVPAPAQGQVLLRVTAVAANPVDAKAQRGDYGSPVGSIYGHDVAGVVAGVGPDVDAFAVGDRVAAFIEGVGRCASNGGYSEYVAVSASFVAPIPSNMSDEEAAASVLTGLTAYECILHAKVREGDTVLVTGAAGGVGSFVVQLCRHFAGKSGRVITTAGGDPSMEYVRDQLGIPEDMIVRYRGKTVGDMVEAVKACNGGVGVSVAFDMVGKDMKRLCLQATDFGARVVSIVSEGADFADDAAKFFNGRFSVAYQKNLTMSFEFLGARALFNDADTWVVYGEELRSLFKLMESETVKPPVCENLGALCADTVAKMHARLLESSVRGKLTASVAQ